MNNIRLQEDFEELFSDNNNWIEKLDNSTVFITGATGLIGSVTACAILFYDEKYNRNIKVVCCVRNREKAEEIFNEYADSKNMDICVGDINDRLVYNDNVDYIIHCANTTSSKEYVEKPVETIQTIVFGTNNMLSFAREKNAKGMVYLSSMEAYGAVALGSDKISEIDYGYIDTSSVRSSYSEGKRLAECLCSSYSSEYGIKVVIARLAQVFGAGADINDQRVFMQLARSAIYHTDFVMYSDGSSYGNYCYTTDAVKAIIMLLTEGMSGEIYNVVNEDNCMTIREMAEMVAHKIAGDSFKIEYDVSGTVASLKYAPKTTMRLSSDKLNRLGWKAKVGLEEMYMRCVLGLDNYYK